MRRSCSMQRQDGTGVRQQGMVVRIKPVRNTVYCDGLFDRQYRLIQLLHKHGAVKVAPVVRG